MLLRTKADGEVLGAVGISGASADEDEYCALQGVWSCSADDIANTCTTEPLDHSVRTDTCIDRIFVDYVAFISPCASGCLAQCTTATTTD